MDIATFILNELLDSSSSSDEDEELIIKLMNPNIQSRFKGFVENVVQAYSNSEFKENLRVSRETAAHLIERYSQSYLKRNYKGGRLQTSVETEVLAFLWFSGNKTTFREVSNLFGISLSNVHRCFNRVLSFLVNDLAPEVIQFPRSINEKENVSNEFEKIAGIPNILGCIGTSYIAARTPKSKISSMYANRNDGVSIALQGVCDSNLRFLDVFTGISSKISDSGVLELSLIGKELPILCSDKYYLLGDSAYPLKEYLLTPYIDNENLNECERSFNTHFCRTRNKIENAFCLLKSRFRQLMRIDFHNVETMTTFVTGCCVLHNICIDRNESLPREFSNTELNNSNDKPMDDVKRDIQFTQLGQTRRDKVKNLLFK